MKTIGIYHVRGGVGKSAVTVFLADFLSTLYDKRVLVIDLDPQNFAAVCLVGSKVLEKAFDENRSLPRLLDEATLGELNKERAESFVIRRGQPTARSETKYLAEVSILAGSRKDWRKWQDGLIDIPQDEKGDYFDILSDSLKPLGQHYDICLIDFPAGSRTLAKIGIRASDWWLLPEIPDSFGFAFVGNLVDVVHEAQKNSNHRIRLLGTLFNNCPNRRNASYRNARAAFRRLSEEGGIPPLFSKQSEIPRCSVTALGGFASASDTLVTRYGSTTTPFYTGLRNLAKEVLDRLDEKHKVPKLSVLAKFRRRLADYWR